MVVVASNPVLIRRVGSVGDLGMFAYREKARTVWLFLSVDTLDCWVATTCFIYLLIDTFLLHQLFRLQELNLQVILPYHFCLQRLYMYTQYDPQKKFRIWTSLGMERHWFLLLLFFISHWFLLIYHFDIYMGQRKRKKQGGKNNGGQQFSSPWVGSNLFALATSFCFTFFYLYTHKCYYFKSIIFCYKFFHEKRRGVCQWISCPHVHFLL